LITPTTPTVAWPLGQSVPPGLEAATVWSFFTYPFNLTGQPAASLPCGTGSHGLPVGLQMIAAPQAEATLIAALAAAEQALALPVSSLPLTAG